MPFNTLEYGTKSYVRGVEICLKIHPDVFYRILRKGSGEHRHGPPCDDCRVKAITKPEKVLVKKVKKREPKRPHRSLRKPFSIF